jgi:predicted amidophosphoribosyltransferase
LLNHVVKRSKETARQSEHDEPAERYANVAQAFCVVRPAAVYQQRLVLVDDVLTSGATLAALAEVLFEQGAADVRAMVFASGRAELVH